MDTKYSIDNTHCVRGVGIFDGWGSVLCEFVWCLKWVCRSVGLLECEFSFYTFVFGFNVFWATIRKPVLCKF